MFRGPDHPATYEIANLDVSYNGSCFCFGDCSSDNTSILFDDNVGCFVNLDEKVFLLPAETGRCYRILNIIINAIR